MRKKMYEKPTMEVLECEQEVQLLAGSVSATMDGEFVEEEWVIPG